MVQIMETAFRFVLFLTLSLFPELNSDWWTMENNLNGLDVSWYDPSLAVVYNYWKKSLDHEQMPIAAFPNEP